MSLEDMVIPPWVKPLAIVVAVLTVVATVYFYGQKQFGLGEKARDAEWLNRENKELVAANAEILRLHTKIKADEKAAEDNIAAIATKYEKEKQIEKANSDRVIADLRSGNAGLFYYLASSQGAIADGMSRTGGSTSGRNGGTEAQLPTEIGADLYSEASRANDIVRQLNACQQIIIEDRKLCHK